MVFKKSFFFHPFIAITITSPPVIGHVYCVQSNRLVAFWDGDLHNNTVLTLPYKDLNSNLIQTNGMLVTQDGYLVIKQWNYILEDVLFFVYAKGALSKIFIAFIVIFSSVVYYLLNSNKSKKHTSAYVPNVLIASLIGTDLAIITWVELSL